MDNHSRHSLSPAPGHRGGAQGEQMASCGPLTPPWLGSSAQHPLLPEVSVKPSLDPVTLCEHCREPWVSPLSRGKHTHSKFNNLAAWQWVPGDWPVLDPAGSFRHGKERLLVEARSWSGCLHVSLPQGPGVLLGSKPDLSWNQSCPDLSPRSSPWLGCRA